MIRVTNIYKSFGPREVVKDVSFEIQEGEVAALLGPNGAGKTTTMRMMTGYYVPDSGDVTIGELSITNAPVEAKRRIGYLPESNPLYRDMLVSEYLTFTARLMDMQRSTLRGAFDRVVADTGIDEVFFRPISELSKGYRQRVGLAGALMSDPEVLILDEPTEGLDPNQRTDIRTLLGRLSKHKTVLISTHVLAEAQQVASRIIVLNKGMVAGQGTVQDLLSHSTGRSYTIEVEGVKPDKAIYDLASVADVHVMQQDGAKMRLQVVAKDADALPRELSHLIGTHKFVLHRMEPDAGGLERVFSDLTREPAVPSAITS
jgi:ABC-2 type transport system ATP-binding protein